MPSATNTFSSRLNSRNRHRCSELRQACQACQFAATVRLACCRAALHCVRAAADAGIVVRHVRSLRGRTRAAVRRMCARHRPLPVALVSTLSLTLAGVPLAQTCGSPPLHSLSHPCARMFLRRSPPPDRPRVSQLLTIRKLARAPLSRNSPPASPRRASLNFSPPACPRGASVSVSPAAIPTLQSPP